MILAGWLWVVFTLLAAACQTVRNAMQRELTASLGTAGATHVRFLFGFPFAILILLAVWLATGTALPRPGWEFLPWVMLGAGAQFAATAAMLAAMKGRSFVVAIAYIKTEAIQAAVFGLVFLGDPLTAGMVVAIMVATAGVVLMSISGASVMEAGLRPTVLGLLSGGLFALSATGHRGAILTLQSPDFIMAATFTMTVGLLLQVVALMLYLVLRDRALLAVIGRRWRPSVFAGLMGAVASEFWFLAFALTSVANVRTLALVEVIFAQAISYLVFRQKTTPREAFGMSMIIAGVALLLFVQRA